MGLTPCRGHNHGEKITCRSHGIYPFCGQSWLRNARMNTGGRPPQTALSVLPDPVASMVSAYDSVSGLCW